MDSLSLGVWVALMQSILLILINFVSRAFCLSSSLTNEEEQDVLKAMEFSFNLIKYFEKVVSEAALKTESINESFEPQMRLADQRFGDFQANGVLPYAKETDATQENCSEIGRKYSSK